jgi:ABC-type branched-subunit amino acid transport system permease subunit
MSPPAFDPFGEPVPSADPLTAPQGASKWLESAGISLFWGLVGMIVLARALYFEPGAFSFGGALAWAQGLVALF